MKKVKYTLHVGTNLVFSDKTKKDKFLKKYAITNISYEINKLFGINNNRITHCKDISDTKVYIEVDMYYYLINISPNKYKQDLSFIEKNFGKYGVSNLEHFYKQEEIEVIDHTYLEEVDVSTYNTENITNFLL